MITNLSSYTSNPVQDLIISKRVLNGEKELFELLLRPHKKSLYLTVRALLKDERQIEKALTNAHSSASRNLYRFYGQTTFRAWLLSVGILEAKAFISSSDQEKVDCNLPDNSQLGLLAPLPRMVFVLKKLLLLTTKEVAICLEISLHEVKKLDALARTLLGKNYSTLQAADFLSLNNTHERPATDTNNESAGRTNCENRQPGGAEQTDVMVQMRHEHQQNLVVCYNIRRGFSKGIEMDRIKRYTDWYWKEYLSEHFTNEEKDIFPILGEQNDLVKKAMAGHRRLRRLFESKADVNKVLNRIEEELEAHILFEEKVLFREIEKTGTKGDMARIETLHSQRDDLSWNDEFWK